MAQLAAQDQLVRRVRPLETALPVTREQLEYPAEWDRPVPRDSLELLVLLVPVDLPDRKDCLAVQDNRDSRVTLDQVDQWVLLGWLAVVVVLELLVRLALLETLVQREPLDLLVFKVPRV